MQCNKKKLVVKGHSLGPRLIIETKEGPNLPSGAAHDAPYVYLVPEHDPALFHLSPHLRCALCAGGTFLQPPIPGCKTLLALPFPYLCPVLSPFLFPSPYRGNDVLCHGNGVFS
ncbi:hypothetical protein DPEC_G00255410 [Dallia pectoralis]|uniref:Uncharacterized protein n=1 Tax=Dallia pectoralis TaxID=75939 RepID=A0ACC2FUI5_DALPE|nr:hypothetical protein DPEC_G00255410 [Dallia pectoralis]